eukprot:TRINITY_DN50330_c0_g1_i1.p1 TRINITY_DN50330_c0_g1~~TRINITY_DN50330_c0_g1_i1.p1  ORF type:complete len:315 (-),score=52.07 TRINITY_DN50330_c0_g1_i1:65-1009(-)
MRMPWWLTVLLLPIGCMAGCVDGWANCTALVAEHGCDHCCLDSEQPPYRLTVRSMCGASCRNSCDLLTNGSAYQAEQRALVALFESSAGGHWLRNDSWLDLNRSHCEWFGVNCDANGSVSALALYSNNLSGTLPTQLGQLARLTLLRLYRNSGLSGSVPSLGSLGSLRELALDRTSISGNLSWVTQLTHLDYLAVRHTQLSGVLPPALGSLTNLTVLAMTITQISGTIPGSIFRLSMLKFLAVGASRISGTLSDRVASLTSLQTLDCAIQPISGTVPSAISGLLDLQDIYICLLYTSDAADEEDSVDLGSRRII